MSNTTVNELIMQVLQSDATQSEKIALVNEIRKARPPLEDRWLYRSVVWALAAAVVLTVLCATLLAYWNINLADGVVAVGSAAVGALAALITPKQHQTDQQ